MRRVIAASLAVVLAGACAADPQLVVIGGDTCEFDGPVELIAGDYEFVVSGDATVDVYTLAATTRYEDIEAHYEAAGALRHPPGATRIFSLNNPAGLRHDRSMQNATSRRHTLGPGDYAIVCEWRAGGASGRRAVSSLTVGG